MQGTKNINNSIAIFLVAAELQSRKYECFFPASHGSSCSIIAIKNGKPFRIQVGLAIKGCLSKTYINYPRHRYDILAIVSKDKGIVFRSKVEEMTA